MDSPMRRIVLPCLLMALLLAPAAQAAGPIQVIRDCEDDGVLQGHYTNAELRQARNQLPTDVDEYSDCRDILSRAIAAGTTARSSGNGGNGGTTTGGGAGGGGTGSGGSPSSNGRGDADPYSRPIDSSTSESRARLSQARVRGDDPIEISGRPVRPATGLADTTRNRLPGTLIAVLALLAAAALVAVAPVARRRVLAHRQP